MKQLKIAKHAEERDRMSWRETQWQWRLQSLALTNSWFRQEECQKLKEHRRDLTSENLLWQNMCIFCQWLSVLPVLIVRASYQNTASGLHRHSASSLGIPSLLFCHSLTHQTISPFEFLNILCAIQVCPFLFTEPEWCGFSSLLDVSVAMHVTVYN